MTRMDSGEEVRWRIERWNARVESAQSITISIVRLYMPQINQYCGNPYRRIYIEEL